MVGSLDRTSSFSDDDDVFCVHDLDGWMELAREGEYFWLFCMSGWLDGRKEGRTYLPNLDGG